MAKRRQPNNFDPVVVYDRMGFVKQLWIAVDADGEDVILLVSDTTRFEVFTRDVLVGQIGDNARFAVSTKDPVELALSYKRQALTHGATPEAIRLIGLLCPLTREEEETMSDKKLAPKKGDKEALKGAAKAAPVGGKKSAEPKQKGNVEALAKAREAGDAKREAFLGEKLTVLVKPKDTTLRGGRLAKLQFVADAKPKRVGDVMGQTFTVDGVEYTIDKGALNGMLKREHIKIG